jgi:hypothetical protein
MVSWEPCFTLHNTSKLDCSSAKLFTSIWLLLKICIFNLRLSVFELPYARLLHHSPTKLCFNTELSAQRLGEAGALVISRSAPQRSCGLSRYCRIGCFLRRRGRHRRYRNDFCEEAWQESFQSFLGSLPQSALPCVAVVIS